MTTPSNKIETDILVIGAGSGGLSVASGAAQMGARVVLLEGAEMGGDCLNTGCVPSKALLASAKMASLHTHSTSFGVTYSPPEISFAKAKDHVRSVIDAIAPHDSQERFEGLGVHVIRAFGRFISDREVTAGDHIIRARRIIIATGSSPAIPPIPGLDTVPYLTNETIFDLAERPEHLLIIGGGAIGLEMAQAHRRLGSQVTVFEADLALGRDDPEAAKIVVQTLTDAGIIIHENAQVTAVKSTEKTIALTLESGESINGSHVLVATGRTPNIADLNLEAAGIDSSPQGIRVNKGLRTSNRRVYAIGDAIGGAGFTHRAGYHAGLVIRSAVMALPAKERTDHIPHVTYTDPELAQVGLTETEAQKTHGNALTVIRLPYAQNDRARAQRQTDGFVKIMVLKGRPIGATIVGVHAGELINLWSLAIAQKMKLSKITGMVSPYPTLGELNKHAAGAYFTPKLFGNPTLKRFIRLVQRWLP